MATFSISLSVEVEADSYQKAYELQSKLMKELNALPEVDGVYEIDVECTDGDAEDEE